MKNFLLFWAILVMNADMCFGDARRILFFVDWHNERIDFDLSQPLNAGQPGFGPITAGMLANLWQKAAPMVVSAATWQNYLARKRMFHDFYNLPNDQLLAKYLGKSPRFATANDVLFFQNICRGLGILGDPAEFERLRPYHTYLICHFVEFNEHEWVVSKISPHVYLFVPAAYVQAVEKEAQMPAKVPGVAGNIRDEDLLLGLKYNNNLFHDVADVTAHDVKKNVRFEQELITALGNIFVQGREISGNEQHLKNYQHTFDVYAEGHGGPGGIIMGLPAEQFRAFLDFLNNLRTRFLFYNTCFAGGDHLQLPYGAGEFNFVITTGTFLPAVTLLNYSWFPNIEFHINFSDYFQRLDEYFANKRGVTLEDVIRTVYQIGHVAGNWQLPTARFQGWPHFKVIQLRSMYTIDARTVEQHKNNIMEIDNKQTIVVDVDKLVLELELSHQEVTVPVIIKNTMPAVFTLSTDAALYSFTSITTDSGLIEFVKGFIPMKGQEFSRTYYINHLECRNDIGANQKIVFGAQVRQLTLNNVVIFNNAPDEVTRIGGKMNGVLFFYNGASYFAQWKDNNDFEWAQFDAKFLPNFQTIALRTPVLYKNLFDRYIRTLPRQYQGTVQEIVDSFAGAKQKVGDKQLIDALNALTTSLGHIARSL